MFRDWIRSLCVPSPRFASRRPFGASLRLETLGDRCLPSVVPMMPSMPSVPAMTAAPSTGQTMVSTLNSAGTGAKIYYTNGVKTMEIHAEMAAYNPGFSDTLFAPPVSK